MSTLTRVYIGGSNRYTGQFRTDKPSLSIQELEMQVSDHPVLLWGGEPTLRKDLPQVIQLFSKNRTVDVAIHTDAVLLSKEGVALMLVKSGLKTVYITFPSSRKDACDWLLGKGILGKTIRGIRNSIRAGLTVIADVPLTRSTVDHLDETVVMLHRLGISKVLFRMLNFSGVSDRAVILAPRFGVLSLPLQMAVNQATQLGVSVEIEGIPDCMLGSLKQYRKTIDGSKEGLQCVGCSTDCCKVANGYVSRFGWAEIWKTKQQSEPTSVSLYFPPQETSRSIRKRLMYAAQSLVQELWLLGDYSHQMTYPILRETLRLSIDKVCLVGDLRPLLRLTKLELLRLRNIHLIAHQIQNPELDPQVLELFERWKGPVQRVYAQVETVADVIRYDRMFQQGKLPSAPFYRIVGTGSIEDFLPALPLVSTASRNNLLLTLPYCLHREKEHFPRRDEWMMYNDNDRRMKITDFFPRFHNCTYAETCQKVHCCVGLINGYTASTIEAIVGDDK